jgi:hypothetical protein
MILLYTWYKYMRSMRSMRGSMRGGFIFRSSLKVHIISGAAMKVMFMCAARMCVSVFMDVDAGGTPCCEQDVDDAIFPPCAACLM